VNKIRAKMPPGQRAKQFAPFDALSGLGMALKENERIRVRRKTLSEDMAEELDRTMRSLMPGDIITVVFYNASRLEYIRITGKLTALNASKRRITVGETEIGFDDIYNILRG
jgi:hypothetical protein